MSLRQKAFSTDIEYPESDGKPMAETDVHAALMIELRSALEAFFRDAPDVYVSGNLLLYYVEGDPRQCVAPDVFVVRGVGKRQRRIYKLWEEGRAPDVVFEISSRGTYKEDLQRKWQLYAHLGVAEYYIFDPEYDYLKEGLLAYRLSGSEYAEVDARDGALRSEVLGLDVVDTGETLRLRDPQTGRFLPTRQEMLEAQQQAEARARAEAEARQQAEAELARLREELARLRSQS